MTTRRFDGLRVLAGVIALLSLSAASAAGRVCSEVDAVWFRRTVVQDHLAHWLAAAPSDSGLYRSKVDREWRPAAQQRTDLTAQSRLIYAMASGFDLTGDARYLDAVRSGADFLLQHFADPMHPGFFRRVDESGRVIDDSKHTYGHAFAIFGLAHAYRVTRDKRYRESAFQTWYAMNVFLGDATGGYRPGASRDFAPNSGLRTQNPVMHLFEAMLALWDATKEPAALEGAQRVGDFVLRRLLEGLPDGGAFIAEWYDGQWVPLKRDKGGYIDLGHQFEWAYLLSAGEQRGLPSLYGLAAERLMSYGLRVGYDSTNGGTLNSAEPDHVRRTGKGWWQQAELLRALMHHAAFRGQTGLWPKYRQTLAFVRSEFVDSVNGGWYGEPRSACMKSACKNVQPGVGYHVTAMHREAIELTSACAAR